MADPRPDLFAKPSEDPLFVFGTGQFEDLMRTDGLESTTRAIVEESNDMLGGNVMTYESLQDGTATIFSLLPDYKDLAPEDRKLSAEAMLSLFTNVEDYGQYDPNNTSGTKELRAAGHAALRTAPEAVAGGYGFSYGMRAAAPLANLIPAAGIPGLIAKGVVLVGGGFAGAIAAAMTAETVEEAVIGEKAPVMPSLQSAANFGEAATYGVSMLHAPWTMNPARFQRAGPGAINFLDNFKNVASGKFAGEAAEKAIELTAKNAGLTKSAFNAANKARESAKIGPMFGGSQGTNVLGLGRLNPKGYLLDPTKGPVTGRVLAGVQGGYGKSMQYGVENYKTFLGMEMAAGAGAGTLSYVSQAVDPYDRTSRFVSELAGAAVIPIPARLLVEHGPKAARNTVGALKRWLFSADGIKEGILKTTAEKKSAERIIAAIQESAEYEGPEQLNAFIESLMKVTADADGNPLPDVEGTVKSLSAAWGMPLSKTMGTIEDQLSVANKELEVATSRGRDQLLIGAKRAIATIVATGDPTMMNIAGRLQETIFEQAIIDNMERRIATFYGAANRVIGDEVEGGSNRVNLSTQLHELLTAQIASGKVVEKEFWNEVKNFPIDVFKARNGKMTKLPNLLRLLDTPSANKGLKFESNAAQTRLRTALGELGADIDDFRAFFQPKEGAEAILKTPVTSQKLVEMRSVVQDKAAQFRSAGQLQLARQMDLVEDAILRDLTGVADSTDAAYNVARAYTYARQTVFTRSFLGDVQKKGRDRAFQMSPEALADQFLRGGNRATSQRINEINEVGLFGLEHNLPEAELNKAVTFDTLNLVIRDSLRKIVDKKAVIDPITKRATGQFEYVVNPGKLETWKKQPGTKEIFAIFPKLADDLANAEEATKLMKMADNDMVNLGKSPQTLAFQSVLEFADRPAGAVASALAGKSPAKSLQELADLAKNSPRITDELTGLDLTPEDALLGLRNAIMDNAAIHSGGLGLSFNATAFEDQLFSQIKGVSSNQKFTMMDFMINNNMIDEVEVSNIQKFVKQMRGIEDAFATGNMESVLFKNPSLSKIMYTKMLGATFGVKAFETLNKMLTKVGLGTSGNSMGGGMASATAGSQAIQNLLLRGPESMMVKTMSTLLANPKLLAPLMKELTDKKSADAALKTLTTGFSGLSRESGRRLPYALRYMREDSESTIPTEEEAEQLPPVAVPIQNQQGSAPTALPRVEPMVLPSQQVQPSLPQLQQAPQQKPPQLAASGPVDRERYAALFPEDRALMAGIGSLGGGAA